MYIAPKNNFDLGFPVVFDIGSLNSRIGIGGK